MANGNEQYEYYDEQYEYYDDEEYEEDGKYLHANNNLGGLPMPNTYEPTHNDSNNLLSTNTTNNFPQTKYKKPPPVPPSVDNNTQQQQQQQQKQPPPILHLIDKASDNSDSDDTKKELGTSDNYIDKQLIKVMDGLKIAPKARPAMFNLPKQQKLTMIQQYNRQQNGTDLPKVSNVKRQNQPRASGPDTTKLKLVPIMGKNISAPQLTGDSSTPSNTISLEEARKRQKHERSKTPNPQSLFPIHNGKHPKNTTKSLKKIKSQPALLQNGHKSKLIKKSNPIQMNTMKKSHSSEQNGGSHHSKKKKGPPPVPKNINTSSKSDPKHSKRLSLPPPVPSNIKQKYANKSGTDSNRSSVKSFESNASTSSMDEVNTQEMDTLVEGDEEYEYYEDNDQYQQEAPKPKMKNIKVKLRVGSEVEVFSNSKQKWIDGNIVKIKGKLICVAYGPGAGTQKWLEATSKNFRPKIQNSLPPMIPSMNPSTTSNAAYEAKVESPGHRKNKSFIPSQMFDQYNNPTPQRFRKSVAFRNDTKKQQLKIKLRIGSAVEVFSVSKNRWIDGKLTGIKKDLIRVAYGQGFTTEKWLRANSKQFRPKLDYVDAAVEKQKSQKTSSSKPKSKHKRNISAMHGYEVDSDEESKAGTYIPNLIPNYGPNGGGGIGGALHAQPPPVPSQHQPAYGAGSGAFVTTSVRREQYQQFSVETIKGSNTKRGDLKIKVHGALQLRSNGNFASIKVAEHCLKTKKVQSDENPVWKEILTFSNFRPHIGKTGIISIYHKSAIMGEKLIGSAEFELPIVFGRQEKMTIDIADSKNKLSGIVVLEQCVVDSGR